MNIAQEQNRHCIDVCNSLLRGELSAIEAYSQVIHRFANEPQCGTLIHIRDEHLQAVDRLRQNIRDMGGDPDTDSGAWGTLVKTLQGTANLLGENSALHVLEQGEEHGRNEYREALADDEVLAGCKQMIRGDLLPRIEQHLATLERLGNP